MDSRRVLSLSRASLREDPSTWRSTWRRRVSACFSMEAMPLPETVGSGSAARAVAAERRAVRRRAAAWVLRRVIGVLQKKKVEGCFGRSLTVAARRVAGSAEGLHADFITHFFAEGD